MEDCAVLHILGQAILRAGGFEILASGTPDDLKAQAADEQQPDPTMEQAFITLIHDWDKENAHAQ